MNCSHSLWTMGNWDRIIDPMSPDSKKAKFMESETISVECYEKLQKA